MKKLTKWWSIYKENPLGVFGLITLTIIIIIAMIGPYIAPYDPDEMVLERVWQPPSWQHLLGCNHIGQDVLSRILSSMQISIWLGIVVSSITTTIGTLIGLTAGYYGGIVDELIVRLCDIIMTLPGFALMLVMSFVLGPGIVTIAIVVIVTGWAGPVRRMRVMVLAVKRTNYIESAKSMGVASWRIILHHMLPHVGGLYAASITSGVTRVIMMEAALSFLGFGDPYRLSLGKVLKEGTSSGAFAMGAWWVWIPAGAILTLIGLSCIFIGNAINERFVLRMRVRRGMM